MSRSYKKNPFVTDHSQGTKYMKRLANHKVRRIVNSYDELPSKLKPKKMTESWDICDYYWIETNNFDEYYGEKVSEWLRWGYKYYPYPKREEVWKDYCKMYLRK